MGELLAILGITKQSLGRVLTPLVEQGYVLQSPGRSDRRQRLLSLTPKGRALEGRLFECQREHVMRAYDKKTGAVLGEVSIPGMMGSMPMTYMQGGKQYLAFTVGTRTEPAPTIGQSAPAHPHSDSGRPTYAHSAR